MYRHTDQADSERLPSVPSIVSGKKSRVGRMSARRVNVSWRTHWTAIEVGVQSIALLHSRQGTLVLNHANINTQIAGVTLAVTGPPHKNYMLPKTQFGGSG